MRDNRTLLTVLAIVFFAVLIYNVLYFTGFIGGGDASVQPVQDEPLFGNVPGLDRAQTQQPTRPMPSGQPGVGAAAPPSGPARGAAARRDLTLSDNWGRNPFLSPREIVAVANFRPPMPVQAFPNLNLRLMAVVTDSDGRKVAVVNNEVLHVGDVVAGLEIIQVLDDAVIFQYGEVRHMVRMADTGIRLESNAGASPGRFR
jgi:hypothetical protein